MRKYTNLAMALILSLGTLSAITVLTINLLSLSNLYGLIGHKYYMLTVIYSEVILCFACAYVAQRIFRINPVFFAVVFILLKTIIRLTCFYFISGSIHFWAEATLSLIFSIAGAYLASLVNERENMNRPVQPAIAVASAIAIPVFIWLITLAFCRLR